MRGPAERQRGGQRQQHRAPPAAAVAVQVEQRHRPVAEPEGPGGQQGRAAADAVEQQAVVGDQAQ
nr:hypothetical protein RKE32_12140 [Streptomyces sp. Li-HN-5-13]